MHSFCSCPICAARTYVTCLILCVTLRENCGSRKCSALFLLAIEWLAVAERKRRWQVKSEKERKRESERGGLRY